MDFLVGIVGRGYEYFDTFAEAMEYVEDYPTSHWKIYDRVGQLLAENPSWIHQG